MENSRQYVSSGGGQTEHMTPFFRWEPNSCVLSRNGSEARSAGTSSLGTCVGGWKILLRVAFSDSTNLHGPVSA